MKNAPHNTTENTMSKLHTLTTTDIQALALVEVLLNPVVREYTFEGTSCVSYPVWILKLLNQEVEMSIASAGHDLYMTSYGRPCTVQLPSVRAEVHALDYVLNKLCTAMLKR